MQSDPAPSPLLCVLLVQLIASCGMASVIWFVQLITYPQFAEIDEASFASYHEEYSNRVTWIVAPLMLIELGTAAISAFFFWKTPHFGLAAVLLLIVVTLWSLTTFVQVPQHARLSYGYSRETIDSLVRGNWARTGLWSVKAFLTSLLLYRHISGTNEPVGFSGRLS